MKTSNKIKKDKPIKIKSGKIAEIKCPLCDKIGLCKYEEPATPQDCFKDKWHNCEPRK